MAPVCRNLPAAVGSGASTQAGNEADSGLRAWGVADDFLPFLTVDRNRPMRAIRALASLRIPRGIQPGDLNGNRKGQHGIRVHNQWRVCFF